MGKKRARGAGAEEGLEEFGAGQATGAGREIIEYEPEAEYREADVSVEEAGEEAGVIAPHEALLQARDELAAKFGGFEAIAAVAAQGAGPDRIGIENIQGIGVGIKEVGGTLTGELAVKVFVMDKVRESHLSAETVIPPQVNGYPTDIEPVGEFYAASYARRYSRPVPCGASVGHPRITAGTLGCLVVLNNNRLCVLGNNHVLANSNNVQSGDPVLQPGPSDGGSMPEDRIGVLERFVPIQFPGPNTVDAAAAWTAFRLVSPEHITYTLDPTPLAPALALSVVKNGRTTQATMGVITGMHVNNARINYRPRIAVFNDQIVIRAVGPFPFSQGGDSGALIVSAGTKQPVGLLFAGSATHTVANPISSVILQLGIDRFLGRTP